ncbi:hypothetical protein KM043_013538 [Ampulex compressa]|nr:hypothetical protein KM043_013538 [Ampulex compressa]
MKLYLIAALLFVAVCATFGSPAPNDKPFEYAAEVERSGRHARATCNFQNLTGHVACIAHCAFIGKAGGKCRGNICVCNGESLTDALRRITGIKG